MAPGGIRIPPVARKHRATMHARSGDAMAGYRSVWQWSMPGSSVQSIRGSGRCRSGDSFPLALPRTRLDGPMIPGGADRPLDEAGQPSLGPIGDLSNA